MARYMTAKTPCQVCGETVVTRKRSGTAKVVATAVFIPALPFLPKKWHCAGCGIERLGV